MQFDFPRLSVAMKFFGSQNMENQSYGKALDVGLGLNLLMFMACYDFNRVVSADVKFSVT